MTVEVGQQAPDFELRDQHGQTVALSTFRGAKAVVLMFYPFAFSRVCTGELSEIRDNLDRFQSDDVQVLALSCDPMFTLRAFADQDRLTFPLLSDFWPHGAAATAYGVLDTGRGSAHRSTYIVGTDGVVRWCVHNPTGEARDLEEQAQVLAELARDRSGPVSAK